MQVPTVLIYPKNSSTPSSWGFYTEHPVEQKYGVLKESFTIYLDEETLQGVLRDPDTHGIFPASMQEVEKL
jgi:hypothetical protein